MERENLSASSCPLLSPPPPNLLLLVFFVFVFYLRDRGAAIFPGTHAQNLGVCS